MIDNPPQNLFAADALTDLSAVITEADKSDVRAVLLRAECDDFSAGADVSVFSGVDDAKAASLAGAVMGIIGALEELSVPTVARIEGQCYDGAVEICLACDLIWAAKLAEANRNPRRSTGRDARQDPRDAIASLQQHGLAVRPSTAVDRRRHRSLMTQ